MLHVLVSTALAPDDLVCLVESFPHVRFEDTPSVADGCRHPDAEECVLCDRLTEAYVRGAQQLKWVQVRSAGIEHMPLRAIADRGIVLTNGSGAHGIAVAELVLAMMSSFAIGLPELSSAKHDRSWVRPVLAPRRFELEGSPLLVLGLGDLGGTLARKARGIGMRVSGWDPYRSDMVEHLNERVAGARLDEALSKADHVALCMPITDETRGILDAGRIALLKPTAYLYNVGRGALVDTDALVEALSAGRLAGAGLDVTDPEPLPPDHALWNLPNVLLTQHLGGASPHNSRRITDLFSENLHRYLNGTDLLNRVDPVRGF